jgi:hypothetical protein
MTHFRERGFAAYFVFQKGWGVKSREQGIGNRDQKDRD